MNYRRETANWQNKYNNLLDDIVAASVAVYRGRQLKVSVRLGGCKVWVCLYMCAPVH